ncbi:MAG: hypothetical protein RL662_751 [Bacteroidota bacterium]|jgi:hypothetical protein
MAQPRQIIIEDLPYEERLKYLKNREEQYKKLKSIRQYTEGEKFNYKLTVEGDSHVQTVKSTFQIVSNHELIYLGYDEMFALDCFSLTELSYKLEKYEDPIVAQIVEMSNEISSVYQHLEFGVDKFGHIRKIYNRAEIKQKWEKTKEYLTYKHPLSSYEIIRVKEKELANPKMEMDNISYMHFLQVYFKQYGRFMDHQEFSTTHMDQFGSGIPFELKLKIDTLPPTKEGQIHRRMEGGMLYNSSVEANLRKAVKDDSAKVDYTTKADYYSDGVVLEEVNFNYSEKIGEGYNMYSHLHLELLKDGE